MIESTLRKLSVWCLGVGILAFWPMTWLGFFLPKIILIALGLGIWFLTSWREKVCCKPVIFWAVASYFFILILFTFFSAAPISSLFGVSGAMQGLQTQLLYLGIFVMALMISEEEKKYIFKGLVALHIVVGIYALLQWAQLDPLQHFWDKDAFVNRTFSFLGNPNWLAAFMVLTMPFAFRAEKKFWWWILGFEWLVLFSTGSKAGFLAAALLMVVLFWKEGKKKIIAVMTSCLIVGAGMLLVLFPDSVLLLRSINGRGVIWQDTVKILEAKPLGHGMDIFRFVYPKFSSPALYKYEDLAAAVDHPHNQILQMLFEIGPLGFAAFCLCVFFIFKDKKDVEYFDLKLGVLCYLITNLFGFDVISNGIIFWLILGILARSKENLNINDNFKRGAFTLASILFLIISWLSVNHFYANFYFDNSQKKSIYNLEKAINIYPYDRVYLLQASESILSLKTSNTETLNAVDRYLSFADKLASGLDSEVTILRAWEFAEKGDIKLANDYFNEAMQQQPNSFRNYLIGFEIYKILDQPGKIKMLREEFLKILPDYWNKSDTPLGHIFQKNYPWIIRELR